MSGDTAPPSAPVGVAIASDEDMRTLFRLRENLEDLKRRRWKGKNWDLDDGYVNANIGHAEKAAEWALPALNRALGVLVDNAHQGAALAQQPAAVDEAMWRFVSNAFDGQTTCQSERFLELLRLPEDNAWRPLHWHIQRALAAQPGGSDND